MKKKLLSPTKRRYAIIRKRRIILRTLRDEIWTTIEIIALWIDRSHETTRTTLKQMQRDGLVKCCAINTGYGRKIVVWGLTRHGYAMSFNEDEEMVDGRIMEPSKIRPTTLNHRLDIQKMRIRMQRIGYRDWQADYAFKNTKQLGDKWPDALATNSEGKRVAFEIERTIKSVKRYREIMIAHLVAMKNGVYDKVIYLSPDPKITRRVEKIFHSIETVIFKGQQVSITSEHLSFFKFDTYDA
ncbi:MAG: MobC family replication-relaxation protein [Sedimenticola sp.]